MKVLLKTGLVWFWLVFAGVPGREAAWAQSLSPEEKAADAIRGYVAERLSADRSEIEVKLLNPAAAGRIVSGSETVEVREGRSGELLGRAVFLLTARQSGRTVASQWVTAVVRRARPVVVARHSLKRHQPMESGDLEIRTVYLTQPVERYFSEMEPLIGKRAASPLQEGAPITRGQAEEVPVIRRGDRVTLVFEMEGLKITAVGQAREDGFPGRPLSVFNIDSRKTVYGTVVDGSTVRVAIP